MNIRYTFQSEGHTLTVQASGHDESLDEVQAYGQAVVDEAVRSRCARVLCDERALEYRLGTLDIYDAAAFVAERAPRLARVAIVCDARFGKDASFWQNVAVNRGLSVRMFQDLPSARQWLAQDRPSN
jgi:hypothetical protein